MVPPLASSTSSFSGSAPFVPTQPNIKQHLFAQQSGVVAMSKTTTTTTTLPEAIIDFRQDESMTEAARGRSGGASTAAAAFPHESSFSSDEEKKEDVDNFDLRLCRSVLGDDDDDRVSTYATAEKNASSRIVVDDCSSSSYGGTPLEVTTTNESDDGSGSAVVVVRSTIPRGFAIVDCEAYEGKRIVTTKRFVKGQVIYVGYAAMLDLSEAENRYVLRLYDDDDDDDDEDIVDESGVGGGVVGGGGGVVGGGGGRGRRRFLQEFHNSDTHTVDDYAVGSRGEGGASKRQVYGWDGFMNHSCDPNGYFPLLYRTPTEMCYRAIALRDIEVGEELTCDYALFDYECDGHAIESCACNSAKCRGKMLGFKNLSLREKVDILGMADETIRRKFVEEENVVVFRSTLPVGIALRQDDMDGGDNRYLVAARTFEAGEVLFANRVVSIPREDLVVGGKKIVLEVDGRHILLDNEHHFIHRDTHSEMLGFDSFMDHSCSPNTCQTYVDHENYVVIARRKILHGEKITCDYMALENGMLGDGQGGNVGTSSFVCECGESNCRGVLVC